MWDCVAIKLVVMITFPSMPSVGTVGKPAEDMFFEELSQEASIISPWTSPRRS